MDSRFPGRLLSGLLVVLLCAACGGGHRRALTKASPLAETWSAAELERIVFARVNSHRQSRGLAELAHDEPMSALAAQHSRAMADRRKLSHRGASGRFRVLRPSGMNAFAENVAFNLGHGDPARTAVEGWIGSPGHRRNMLSPTYGLTGIGVARSVDGGWYFTQVFGRRE